MFNFLRRPKNIDIYTVLPPGGESYITYTTSVEEAQAYFHQWARIKWADNFKTWCAWSEGESITSDVSWAKFIQQDYIKEQFSQYAVYKLRFPVESLASLLRMQDLCAPLDLPFITNIERKYYKQITTDLHSFILEKIQNQIKEIDSRDAVEVQPTNG